MLSPSIRVAVLLFGAVLLLPTVTGTAHARVRGASEIALGAYISGAPWDPERLGAYAELVGRMPALVMWYQDWGTEGSREFDRGKLDAVATRGATPLITWDPWAFADGADQPAFAPRLIAQGHFDDYIREWAQAARGWGERLYIRFGHEMNASYYPWGVGNNANTAAEFVAAWRRVVDIFRRERATEVRWVWAPNVAFAGTAHFADVYPGREYVDVIGIDGYNWGSSSAGHSWQSLSEVFRSSYDALAALDMNKPMMIAETASTEDGGDKAAWIRSGFLTAIPSRFKRIKAVVWFHERKETSWHVDSSSASLAAFRDVVASPLYQGRLP